MIICWNSEMAYIFCMLNKYWIPRIALHFHSKMIAAEKDPTDSLHGGYLGPLKWIDKIIRNGLSHQNHTWYLAIYQMRFISFSQRLIESIMNVGLLV